MMGFSKASKCKNPTDTESKRFNRIKIQPCSKYKSRKSFLEWWPTNFHIFSDCLWTSNCCQDVYAPEPEAVSEQLDWEAGVRASEVGPGVQGLPHRRRWLHEHPAGPDRRVDRWKLCRSPWRGSHQVIHFMSVSVLISLLFRYIPAVWLAWSPFET